MHPCGFKKLFHERVVNNIYFDTPGLMHYYDNVEGEKHRLKVRIRWYADTFGAISKPVLEYKIKKGLLGKKESFPLNPFTLDKKFSKATIIKALDKTGVPDSVRDEVLSLQPTLLNSYTRKYFLSDDKKVRITIDSDLVFYKISYFNNTFLNKSKDHTTIVLEMKYDPELDDMARNISTFFPFPLTKSSKYLQGLERISL